MGLEVHHSVDAHLAALAKARCVKHRSASGNEDLILKSAPDNMSVRADEAVVSNAQRMARRASENGVLHDDALAADTYWSSLGDNLRSEHDATARANRDVATYHSIRSDPGGRVYSWRGAIVFDDHLAPLRFVYLPQLPTIGHPVSCRRPGSGVTRCPLWVNSGHRNQSAQCPLHPQKRTLDERIVMSALCQKQTSTSPLLNDGDLI